MMGRILLLLLMLVLLPQRLRSLERHAGRCPAPGKGVVRRRHGIDEQRRGGGRRRQHQG